MSHFSRTKKYTQDKPILASPNGISKIRSANISRDYLSFDNNGTKSIPAGMFVAKLKNSSGNFIFRPLPRAKVTTAITTSTRELSVGYGYQFIAGDVLFIHEPYVEFTIANTNSLTVTFNGRTITSVATGAGNATEAAIIHARTLNESPFINKVLRFVAGATKVYAIAKDGYSNIKFAVGGSGSFATTGSNPVITLDTTVVNTTAIGTVLSVNPTTGKIVLVADSGIAVPVGFNIGVTVESVYGLLDGSYDFTDERPNADAALVSEGNVYLGSLPYFDESIIVDLPELKVAYKF